MRSVKHALIPLYLRLAALFGGRPYPLGPKGRSAVVFLSPDRGNIGDLAIGYAQREYLKRVLPNYRVHVVPVGATYKFLRSIRAQLTSSDVVMVTGGGSMGDLYPRAQLSRMFSSNYLRGFRIISFPQSIIFSSPRARRTSGAKEAKAISKNLNFLLCAREVQSRNEMTSLFDNRVIYSPDIVLSLVAEFRKREELKRSGALLMLRGDNERSISAGDEARIRRQLVVTFENLMQEDNTIPDRDIVPGSEADSFFRMADSLRSVSVVVTDRLHGMIFSVITGTPCVVLPNSNHKIQGTYSAWIEGKCPYVHFLEEYSPDEFDRAVSQVTAPGATESYAELEFDFEELDAAIRSVTE